ncbi:MAG: hypothetical protein J2P21_04225 [Chloracidobacterium sp.]|nr:hypothetical protein [Chloracidobacterium sp.]
MRFVRGIIIAALGILLGLLLMVYRPWRSGANHENGTTGAPVAKSENNQAPEAQGAQQPAQEGKKSTEKVQQPAKEVKPRVEATQGEKREAKSAKRSMPKMRQAVEEEGEDCECQGAETQRVGQVVINVIQPTEQPTAYDGNVTTISVKSPRKTQVIKDTDYYWPTAQTQTGYYWPTTQTVNITVSKSQECPTPNQIWVEFPGQ